MDNKKEKEVSPYIEWKGEDHFFEKFNNQILAYDKEEKVVQLIEKQVERSADREAVIFDGLSLSYQELNEQANQLAHFLLRQNIGPGTSMGLCLERSLSMPIALLAILKTGASLLALDSSDSIQYLDRVLEDAKPRCLLTDDSTNALFPESLDLMICNLEESTLKRVIASQDKANPVVKYASSSIAYFQYTPNSSTDLEVVAVTQQNLRNLFLGLSQNLEQAKDKETWLSIHAVNKQAIIVELLWALSRGSKIVLQPDEYIPVNATRVVDFSLFYFAAQEEVTTENKYRLLLEGAKFADENDLAAIWVPERHFHSFGDQFPNPSVAAAAVAATTKNIKIRSGSVVMPLHDPIRVAEEWAMVDHLSEGRVELSFASGWNPNDFVFAPTVYQQRHQVMKEKIDIVYRLWRGETISRTNGLGNEIEVGIHPKPANPKLPSWVTAGGNPDTYKYAGSIGANVLTLLWGKTKEDLKEKIDIYRSSLIKHGFDPEQGKVAVMLHSFVSDDFHKVKPIVTEPLKTYIRHSIALMKGTSNTEVDAEVEKLVDASFDHHYHTNGLFGTPKDCLSYIQELSKLGVDEIACLIDFGITNDITLENLPYLKQLKDLVKRSAAQQNLLAKRLERTWSTAQLIKTNQVTHLFAEPSFVKTLQATEEGRSAIKSLDTLLLTGTFLKQETKQEILENGARKNYFLYGTNHSTIVNAIKELTPQENHLDVGKALANNKFYVLSPQHEALSSGAIGELYLGGDQLLENGTKLYKTGNLAKCIDGSIELLDSVNRQITINGKLISLAAIEQALETHTKVSEAAVVYRKIDDNKQLLIAYLVLHSSMNASNIRSYLANVLPAYMLPQIFVELPSFTKNENGKINYDGLPLHKDMAMPTNTTLIAPRNEIEIQLAEIWTEILSLKSEQLGIDDSFFEIGANSQSVLKLIQLIRAKFDWILEENLIYKFPTIRALATYGINHQNNKFIEEENDEETIDIFENNLNLFNE